ncbi:hypothetical protein BZA05DRAFT_410230 [Tricharina praecox]|uniref:uncharacterized protein n=1 Tax=Tricharina praecox TaxID=43433 RepID=UPI00221EFDAD|nr:uncharacterized protein BZA05DRAFT_410230 [Tricharina praecox]KAI5844203.1 hypothetical protein BZA05DRAFT_410230 [Tricharina praecox]
MSLIPISTPPIIPPPPFPSAHRHSNSIPPQPNTLTSGGLSALTIPVANLLRISSLPIFQVPSSNTRAETHAVSSGDCSIGESHPLGTSAVVHQLQPSAISAAVQHSDGKVCGQNGGVVGLRAEVEVVQVRGLGGEEVRLRAVVVAEELADREVVVGYGVGNAADKALVVGGDSVETYSTGAVVVGIAAEEWFDAAVARGAHLEAPDAVGLCGCKRQKGCQ